MTDKRKTTVPFTAVTKSMLRLIGLYGLNTREIQVMVAMMHEPPADYGGIGYANQDDLSIMTNEDIADYAGLPCAYAVDEALESLEEKGVISREESMDENGNPRTSYCLEGEWLDEVSNQWLAWGIG